MELNDIKKELYKNNYPAYFEHIRKGIAVYICKNLQIGFMIPVEDMGEATFTPIMEAKHLIRWISK